LNEDLSLKAAGGKAKGEAKDDRGDFDEGKGRGRTTMNGTTRDVRRKGKQMTGQKTVEEGGRGGGR